MRRVDQVDSRNARLAGTRKNSYADAVTWLAAAVDLRQVECVQQRHLKLSGLSQERMPARLRIFQAKIISRVVAATPQLAALR